MESNADPRYLAHVRKLYPGRDLDSRAALNDAAKSARKLLDSPGFKTLQMILEREHRTVEADLRSEREKSQAQYARGHGVLDGLEAPVAVLEAIIAHAESCAAKAKADAESSVRS